MSLNSIAQPAQKSGEPVGFILGLRVGLKSIPESSSQCNSTESILEKRFCQDFIYTRKYLNFSMGFQAV